MCESGVLKIYGRKRGEVTEELDDVYFLPYVIRVIKSRRMRWAGYVTHMIVVVHAGFGGET